VPLDLHRRLYGADPIATLVPHPDDNVAGVTLGEAASYGLGIAMAPRILVADQIERGHLVAPLGFVPGLHELHLWIAPHVRAREDVRRLSRWIQDEMARHVTSGTGAAAEVEDDQRVTTASEV
jgi:LysR family glycine cleavage system transcriptional activator